MEASFASILSQRYFCDFFVALTAQFCVYAILRFFFFPNLPYNVTLRCYDRICTY